MGKLSRRAFLGAPLAAAETLRQSIPAFAAPQCVTGSYPGFLPNRLSVDCASRQNFRLFRQSQISRSDRCGEHDVCARQVRELSGRKSLPFPWLKPKGRSLPARRRIAQPHQRDTLDAARPIPDATLPADEYFCRLTLRRLGTHSSA